MNYINTQTWEYPLTESQVRAAFHNVSFAAADFPPDGYAEVQETAPPPHDRLTQRLVELSPRNIEDRWEKRWSVEPLVGYELALVADEAWARVRTERNDLLAACDWTQLADSAADKTAWAVYRQALRDITTQANPLAIQWPEKP